jgi:hypothetical protein
MLPRPGQAALQKSWPSSNPKNQDSDNEEGTDGRNQIKF